MLVSTPKPDGQTISTGRASVQLTEAVRDAIEILNLRRRLFAVYPLKFSR